MMKTDIFNLIILDESGSMDCVTKQTISGCNETLNAIREAQIKHAKTQNHYVSIFAFQSDGPRPSRYILKNVPVAGVCDINGDDYVPYGNTPLYDAVGSTLVDLKSIVETKKLAIGSVTIITDGYENSSKCYSHEMIRKMISSLKEIGWNFNFIGANIDVERTAASLNIDQCLSFDQSEEGTQEMFHRQNAARERYYSRVEGVMACISADAPMSEVYSNLKDAENGFFDEEDDFIID